MLRNTTAESSAALSAVHSRRLLLCFAIVIVLLNKHANANAPTARLQRLQHTTSFAKREVRHLLLFYFDNNTRPTSLSHNTQCKLMRQSNRLILVNPASKPKIPIHKKIQSSRSSLKFWPKLETDFWKSEVWNHYCCVWIYSIVCM